MILSKRDSGPPSSFASTRNLVILSERSARPAKARSESKDPHSTFSSISLRRLPSIILIILVAALAALHRSASAQSPTGVCPTSPHVVGHPDGGPTGNNDWYANADRTIWATFWGWDFVGRSLLEAYPRDGYLATPKVLWYKPAGSPLTVTGRRLDGPAPPLLYDIYNNRKLLGGIQPSRIDFPTAGCWELDAKAGPSELRFVVQVKSLN